MKIIMAALAALTLAGFAAADSGGLSELLSGAAPVPAVGKVEGPAWRPGYYDVSCRSFEEAMSESTRVAAIFREQGYREVKAVVSKIPGSPLTQYSYSHYYRITYLTTLRDEYSQTDEYSGNIPLDLGCDVKTHNIETFTRIGMELEISRFVKSLPGFRNSKVISIERHGSDELRYHASISYLPAALVP